MAWAAVMGGGSFLHRSLMNDVIDYDTFRTGERREAQYAAFYDFVPKLVQIPGTVRRHPALDHHLVAPF